MTHIETKRKHLVFVPGNYSHDIVVILKLGKTPDRFRIRDFFADCVLGTDAIGRILVIGQSWDCGNMLDARKGCQKRYDKDCSHCEEVSRLCSSESVKWTLC